MIDVDYITAGVLTFIGLTLAFTAVLLILVLLHSLVTYGRVVRYRHQVQKRKRRDQKNALYVQRFSNEDVKTTSKLYEGMQSDLCNDSQAYREISGRQFSRLAYCRWCCRHHIYGSAFCARR